MKPSIHSLVGSIILVGVSLFTPAFAVVNIDYVTVGNPGNVADSTGYGAVGYEYQISKNETTISQYTAFLNAAATTDPNGTDLSEISGFTAMGDFFEN
ncbi:MAG: hypothetical protein ABIS50_14535 [Luteolibacter sp.]|uniref:hypothetical protein n=1 Tax=Luteolibacter sp. TaxID=1962973 RepID=UPI00326710B0